MPPTTSRMRLLSAALFLCLLPACEGFTIVVEIDLVDPPPLAVGETGTLIYTTRVGDYPAGNLANLHEELELSPAGRAEIVGFVDLSEMDTASPCGDPRPSCGVVDSFVARSPEATRMRFERVPRAVLVRCLEAGEVDVQIRAHADVGDSEGSAGDGIAIGVLLCGDVEPTDAGAMMDPDAGTMMDPDAGPSGSVVSIVTVDGAVDLTRVTRVPEAFDVPDVPPAEEPDHVGLRMLNSCAYLNYVTGASVSAECGLSRAAEVYLVGAGAGFTVARPPGSGNLATCGPPYGADDCQDVPATNVPYISPCGGGAPCFVGTDRFEHRLYNYLRAADGTVTRSTVQDRAALEAVSPHRPLAAYSAGATGPYLFSMTNESDETVLGHCDAPGGPIDTVATLEGSVDDIQCGGGVCAVDMNALRGRDARIFAFALTPGTTPVLDLATSLAPGANVFSLDLIPLPAGGARIAAKTFDALVVAEVAPDGSIRSSRTIPDTMLESAGCTNAADVALVTDDIALMACPTEGVLLQVAGLGL